MDDGNHEDADYPVGYGRPPVATRFRKGQSGNPKGRPRGSKTLRSLLERILRSRLTIVEAGELKTIEQCDALLRSLVARAIKGDNRAAKIVLDMMERYSLDKTKDELVIRVTIGGETPYMDWRSQTSPGKGKSRD